MSTGKGKKRVRGRPVFHEEVKEPHRIMLTPTAWKKLQAIAELTNSSVSETIEHWVREYDGG